MCLPIGSQSSVQRTTEKLTVGADWAKVALGDWRKVMKTGDQTTKMISQCCQKDDKRAIALESKRTALKEEILLKQKVLIDTRDERKVVELSLERTSQQYQQSHQERRDLVQTWKDAVNQMNLREKEINNLGEEIEKAKNVSATKSFDLGQLELNLTVHKNKNSEATDQIDEVNVALSDARNNLQKLEESTKMKTAELLATRKALKNESNRLTQMRNKNRQMLLEEQEKEKALIIILDELNLTRQKAEQFKSSSSNAQERLQQVEDLIACEEKSAKLILKEISRLNSDLCHSEHQLKALQNDANNLVAEDKALESSILKIKASCKNQEKERFRQTQIVFNVEFNIQKAKMRSDKMKGACEDDEEKMVLDARQNELKEIEKEKTSVEESIKKQIRETEDHTRKLTNEMAKSAVEVERIVSCLSADSDIF